LNDRIETVLFEVASKIFRNNTILSYPFFYVNIFFANLFQIVKNFLNV